MTSLPPRKGPARSHKAQSTCSRAAGGSGGLVEGILREECEPCVPSPPHSRHSWEAVAGLSGGAHAHAGPYLAPGSHLKGVLERRAEAPRPGSARDFPRCRIPVSALSNPFGQQSARA